MKHIIKINWRFITAQGYYGQIVQIIQKLFISRNRQQDGRFLTIFIHNILC